jgi:hypothetical protein
LKGLIGGIGGISNECKNMTAEQLKFRHLGTFKGKPRGISPRDDNVSGV